MATIIIVFVKWFNVVIQIFFSLYKRRTEDCKQFRILDAPFYPCTTPID